MAAPTATGDDRFQLVARLWHETDKSDRREWSLRCFRREASSAKPQVRCHVAEAEGNRTPLRRDPPHNGFEDRAGHQTRYASQVSKEYLTCVNTQYGLVRCCPSTPV